MSEWSVEWAVVSGAPWISIACLAIAISAIWFIVNWLYSRQIEGLKQQVATAEQNTKLFKDKVPDLEKQLETLRRQVSSHAPYDKLEATTASATTTLAVLSGHLGKMVIPDEVVENNPPSHGKPTSSLDRILDQINQIKDEHSRKR